MIVRDGRLTLPLFHGTSSLHLDSIKSAGLGGRNIVEELGIRRAAQLLVDLSSDICTDEDWLDPVDACTRIARDPAHDRLITPGSGLSWNFRYGGTYLSPSRETAANYTLLYPQGGEALSHVIKLYRGLVQIHPELAGNPTLARLIPFTRESGAAVVVEASEVPLHLLRAEQGGGIEYLLASIEEMLDDPDIFDWMVGPLNFELIGIVPLRDLRFFGVSKVKEFDENRGSREALQFSGLSELS